MWREGEVGGVAGAGLEVLVVGEDGFKYIRGRDGCGAGLEVRVAFNGLWKESLTELSGGQRSLLALSLILAMLLFKPAPIYILDEVLPLYLCITKLKGM